MKFSTRDRYALRLMVELANRAGADALVPLKEISDAQQISLKYLEQIVTPLTKAGWCLACAVPRVATAWPARIPRSLPARSCVRWKAS